MTNSQSGEPTSSTTTTSSPVGGTGTNEGASTSTADFANDVGARNLAEATRNYIQRVRGGEVGALPALLGVLVLVIIFANASDVFLSKGNFANFLTQAAPTAVLAMGLVFVLLLGEIDLSAGTASGVCAATMAIGLVNKGDLHKALGTPTYLALLGLMVAMAAVTIWYRLWFALALIGVGVILIVTGVNKNALAGIIVSVSVGVAIGTLIGFLVARIGIPSFVVTLALFLAWQGVLLQFIGQGSAVPVRQFDLINKIENQNMSPFWSWILWLVAIGGYALYTVTRSIRRRAAKLTAEPLDVVILRIAVIGAATGIAIWVLNKDRSTTVFATIQGVPYVIPIIAIVFIGWTLILSKSRYGRFVYAVGGNTEAARRAGIDTVRVRLSVFVIASGMAGLAGVIQASKQGGVDTAFGNGTTLLYAVAAAVIGGTSLFGGKGKMRDAIIGALVIAMIPNGLGLLRNIKPSYEFLITGLVLLLAASVDALSRKRAAAGR